jgi:hypothetical protein
VGSGAILNMKVITDSQYVFSKANSSHILCKLLLHLIFLYSYLCNVPRNIRVFCSLKCFCSFFFHINEPSVFLFVVTVIVII